MVQGVSAEQRQDYIQQHWTLGFRRDWPLLGRQDDHERSLQTVTREQKLREETRDHPGQHWQKGGQMVQSSRLIMCITGSRNSASVAVLTEERAQEDGEQ